MAHFAFYRDAEQHEELLQRVEAQVRRVGDEQGHQQVEPERVAAEVLADSELEKQVEDSVEEEVNQAHRRQEYEEEGLAGR